MTRFLSILPCLLVVPASIAVAEPLTCRVFRERFDGGLLASGGAATPEAPVYKESGTSADGSRRLTWITPSLSGTLTCGPNQQFKELYVSLAAASKEQFVEQLKRFVATNGAAICATVEAAPAACVDAGKALLQAGLQQMGAAFQKKVTAPSGIASGALQPHLQAELTAAPTLITFTLDVVDAAELDATRAPLAPGPVGLARQP